MSCIDWNIIQLFFRNFYYTHERSPMEFLMTRRAATYHNEKVSLDVLSNFIKLILASVLMLFSLGGRQLLCFSILSWIWPWNDLPFATESSLSSFMSDILEGHRPISLKFALTENEVPTQVLTSVHHLWQLVATVSCSIYHDWCFRNRDTYHRR